MFSSVMQDKFPARDAFVQYAFVARGHSIVMLQTPTHSTAETFDRVIKQTVRCTILLHFAECLNWLQKNQRGALGDRDAAGYLRKIWRRTTRSTL